MREVAREPVEFEDWIATSPEEIGAVAKGPEDVEKQKLGDRLAGVEGLEPPTPGFGDRCSSQLSYTPSRADRCMKARPNARASFWAAHSGVGAATTAVP